MPLIPTSPLTMTKESRIYLDFLRTNLPLLLLPTLLCGALAGYYQNQKPAVEHLNVLMEMKYNQGNVLSQIQLTDQAVSLLREANIQKQLGIGEGKVQVYKPGPLLLTIDISAAGINQLRASLEKLQTYAQLRFPLEQRGEIVQTSQKDSVLIWVAYGAIFGLLLGLLISMIRTYFQYY